MIPLKASATFDSIRRALLWSSRSPYTTVKRRESSSTTILFPLRLFAKKLSGSEDCGQESIHSWKNGTVRSLHRIRFFFAAQQGTYRRTLHDDRKFRRQWQYGAGFPELFPQSFLVFHKTNRHFADSVRMRCLAPEYGCKKMQPRSRRCFLLKGRLIGKQRGDR